MKHLSPSCTTVTLEKEQEKPLKTAFSSTMKSVANHVLHRFGYEFRRISNPVGGYIGATETIHAARQRVCADHVIEEMKKFGSYQTLPKP